MRREGRMRREVSRHGIMGRDEGTVAQRLPVGAQGTARRVGQIFGRYLFKYFFLSPPSVSFPLRTSVTCVLGYLTLSHGLLMLYSFLSSFGLSALEHFFLIYFWLC